MREKKRDTAWEYRTVHCDDSGTSGFGLTRTLNEEARDGWELVKFLKEDPPRYDVLLRKEAR